MHEKGDPFLGGGVVGGTATAQFDGAARGEDEPSVAKRGDDALRSGGEGDEPADAIFIFHGGIMQREVGQRLSKAKYGCNYPGRMRYSPTYRHEWGERNLVVNQSGFHPDTSKVEWTRLLEFDSRKTHLPA